MRRCAAILLLLLGGCQAGLGPGAPLLAVPAVIEGVSLRAFGRTTGDAIVSLVTGEDCSIARIGRGEAYCGRDDPPAPPPLCTRSLGAVDCWTVPPAAWPAHRGVADGPAALSEAQENHRIGWTGRIARAMRPAPSEAPGTPGGEPAPRAAPVPVIEPGPGTPAPVAVPTVAEDAARRALTAPPLPEGAQPDNRTVPPLFRPAEVGDGRGDIRRLLEP
jgi:hypothetical protein